MLPAGRRIKGLAARLRRFWLAPVTEVYPSVTAMQRHDAQGKRVDLTAMLSKWMGHATSKVTAIHANALGAGFLSARLSALLRPGRR
jgi:hypothetical protein